MKRVVVAGGGITGLAAAYYLSRAGASVRLIDKAPRPGGVIQTIAVEGCTLEQGPDSFLAAKPAAVELARELGLEGDIIGSNDSTRVTYVLRKGRLIPLPEGLMMVAPARVGPMVRTSLVGWGTKLRMGLEYFRRPRRMDGDRSVAEFMRDHYGEESLEYLGEPLLAGVYGGDPEKLSVRSVLGRFVEMEEKYGSLTRGALALRRSGRTGGGPLFRTLKRGLGSMVDALVAAMAGKVEMIRAEAETVEAAGGGYRIRAAGEWMEADGFVAACPAWAAAPLLRPVNARLAEVLETIPYHDAMTLSLGYRRQDCARLPPGFGFLVPRREREKMLACTFVHNKFDHRVPAGMAVLRCFFGRDAIAMDDAGVVAAARRELERILDFSAEPVFSSLARWPRAMAQYTVGHEERAAEIESIVRGIPGLEVAGNSLRGIGIPDCIRSAREAAESLTGQAPLGRPAGTPQSGPPGSRERTAG